MVSKEAQRASGALALLSPVSPRPPLGAGASRSLRSSRPARSSHSSTSSTLPIAPPPRPRRPARQSLPLPFVLPRPIDHAPTSALTQGISTLRRHQDQKQNQDQDHSETQKQKEKQDQRPNPQLQLQPQRHPLPSPPTSAPQAEPSGLVDPPVQPSHHSPPSYLLRRRQQRKPLQLLPPTNPLRTPLQPYPQYSRPSDFTSAFKRRFVNPSYRPESILGRKKSSRKVTSPVKFLLRRKTLNNPSETSTKFPSSPHPLKRRHTEAAQPTLTLPAPEMRGQRPYYETAYEERDTFSDARGRGERDVYEETDVYRRPARGGRQPDFLRSDYGRTSAGALVPFRERDDHREEDVRIERDRYERVERDGPGPAPRARPRPRGGTREEDVTIEREHFERTERDAPAPRSRPRPRPRERVERDEEFTRVEHERYERIERERTPTPPPPPPPAPRGHVTEREIRTYERIERTPSPEPIKEIEIKKEIIERPAIHQEIIHHHRHIDHGIEFAPKPAPPPPPPPPKRSEPVTEIETIRRERYFDDDTIRERDSREIRESRREESHRTRGRSISATRTKGMSRSEYDVVSEADYYNSRARERGYMGEAYNGHTRDWSIVDVPPGTERVTMDGVGGASEEISWSRYSGVRRSKFVAPGEQYEDKSSGRRYTAGGRGVGDMWTEVTKDLVVKDALDELGYEYEETEYFYYVMDYLRYDSVLELIEISDEIRAERQQRIREIQWERDHYDRGERRRPRPEREYDEVYREHDYIYEGPPRRPARRIGY